MKKRLLAVFLLLALIVGLAACQKPEPDPHEGMIYVDTGGAYNWLYPVPGFPVSDYKKEDFVREGDRIKYIGTDYKATLGVDVSFHQQTIDWKAVADAGVSFAMIRCGYRGSSEGGLFEDEKFRENIVGATAAGLKVGVYFFSQATGAVEAAEEANYVLNLIKGYKLTMPVAFDWEPLANSRSAVPNKEKLTSAAVTFCEMIKDAGYEPCVYFYRTIAYYHYDLARIKDYNIWLGAVTEYPDFYYKHRIWQFSYQSKIPGIQTETDLNLHFERIAPLPSPSPSDKGK